MRACIYTRHCVHLISEQCWRHFRFHLIRWWLYGMFGHYRSYILITMCVCVQSQFPRQRNTASACKDVTRIFPKVHNFLTKETRRYFCKISRKFISCIFSLVEILLSHILNGYFYNFLYTFAANIKLKKDSLFTTKSRKTKKMPKPQQAHERVTSLQLLQMYIPIRIIAVNVYARKICLHRHW